MEGEERSFEFAAHLEPAQVADYMELLSRHLREGHVHIAAGSDGIQLDLAPNVKLEIAARVKPGKGKGSLQLDISWKQPQHFEDSLRIEAADEAASESALEIASD